MADTVQFRSAVNGFNRNDVMKYIHTLMEEKTGEKERIEALEKQIEALTKKNEALSGQLRASLSRCDNCEIKRENEVKLGTAMLDARRFSELLIREAEDKTYGMYEEAVKNAEECVNKSKEMHRQLETTAEVFSEAFKSLCEKSVFIGLQLEDFCREANAKREDFSAHRSFDAFKKD